MISRGHTAEWEGPAKVMIYFSSGGCIDFTRALVRLSQGQCQDGFHQIALISTEWATRPEQGQNSAATTTNNQFSQESSDDKKNK